MSFGSLLGKLGKSGLVQKAGALLKSPALKNLTSQIGNGGIKAKDAIVNLSAEASQASAQAYGMEANSILKKVFIFAGVAILAIFGLKAITNSSGKRSYR